MCVASILLGRRTFAKVTDGFSPVVGTYNVPANPDRVGIYVYCNAGDVLFCTAADGTGGIWFRSQAAQPAGRESLARVEEFGQLVTGSIYLSINALGAPFTVTELILEPGTAEKIEKGRL